MKNKILYIIFCFSLLLPISAIKAEELCSPLGYTVITINGMITTHSGAQYNKNSIKDRIPSNFNDQNVFVDYVHNPMHIGGVGDAVDASYQKLFEKDAVNDYDLREMLLDLSEKVKTQKVLFVAHSQGNFYANNIYQNIGSKTGGIPKESMGIYGIGTPTSYIAGDGKYITSSTDGIINLIRKFKFLNILPPNVDIEVPKEDDSNGHNLSRVYLKFEGNRITSEIKHSLLKLKTNDIQNINERCISPPKITFIHKIKRVGLVVIDPPAYGVRYVLINLYDGGKYVIKNIGNIFGRLYANVIQSFSGEEIPSGIILDNSNNPPTGEENQEEEDLFVGREDQYPPFIEVFTEEVEENSETEEVVQLQENIPNIGRGPGGQNRTGENNNGGGGSSLDTTPPVITISGSGVMDVIKGTVFVDPGATALDAVDGNVLVVISGAVDTQTIGTYVITYTATDSAVNIASETRTVKVVNDTGVPIVTLNGDSFEVITIGSSYVDPGATALDAIDGNLAVISSGSVDTSIIGTYTITYSATDSSGNIGTVTRTVKVSTYKYIPKYTFGNQNGDSNDWQAWHFNGSSIYDWTDTYVNNYLREQFKIKTITGGFWCSQCLQRGVFNHDPQNGFESTDFTISSFENNPQNNMDGKIYDVVIQWDLAGYTYTISKEGAVVSSGHTNIPNLNNDFWVGWDGSFNNFQTFPSGNWMGTIGSSVMERTGGSGMVLEPFPIYKNITPSQNPILSIPNKGTYTTDGISPTRGRKNLTPFGFEVIYTDTNNNMPQNVKVYVKNTTTNVSLSPVDLQKIVGGIEEKNDGNFVNGEAYVVSNITYDLGEYEYYFEAIDSNGNFIRLPNTGAYRFQAIPSTYTYIPKYTFGTDNGDGNNWQAWAFNGSSVYDWTDTYVNNYLHEQFKIKSTSGGWCSQCLQRGVFNHDPQKGFESYDLLISSLESNPQNNMDNKVYDVSMQWDATGYTYTISENGVTINTGHTNISSINNDFWVGWDGSFNNFQTFPNGNWMGSSYIFPTGYTGGSDMVIKPYPIYVYSAPVLSGEKKILSFNFDTLNPTIIGAIDEANHTVSLSVPYGTDVTSLVPSINISANAQILPVGGVSQDFTNPVTYTVTAENNSTQSYTVTVTILSLPPDTTAPSVTSYTFNGNTSSVTVNPNSSNPLGVVINASENVNWMSIKIENDTDNTLYKMFMSDSSGCVDGTNVCTKSWDGTLSSGGILQSGVYKIKLHIKDSATNEFYDYLTPYLINIDTTI